MMDIRVMTFNTQHCLNYVTRKIDFDVMAKAILDLDADVVGLNEMRGAGDREDFEAQTEKLSELTGYKYFYFAKAIDVGVNNPYGNAILSRLPIECAETVMIADPIPDPAGEYYETRCVLKARLECGLNILISHFGLNPDEQFNAVETVVSNLERERCVLMGDFNVFPDNSVLWPIRERMTDTAEFFEGERLSFPSDVPDRKIDYIFVSRDLEVRAADIPAVVASDHRPHFADISLK